MDTYDPTFSDDLWEDNSNPQPVSKPVVPPRGSYPGAVTAPPDPIQVEEEELILERVV